MKIIDFPIQDSNKKDRDSRIKLKEVFILIQKEDLDKLIN